MKAVYLIKDLVSNTYLNNYEYQGFDSNVHKACVFSTKKFAEDYIQEDLEDVGERILTVVKVYGL